MNVSEINRALALGTIDKKGLFPHCDSLEHSRYIFDIDFGLKKLPLEAGLLLIRGARQYGKSTWLEYQLRQTIRDHGAGSGYYLNGDELTSPADLQKAIEEVIVSFPEKSAIKRLFIDEITAVPEWERALKRLLDSGMLRNVLVVTTGSKAADLRHGSERLPGRKGRLARTHYLFTPVSYRSFKTACGTALGSRLLPAYLLSGGSPVALNALAEQGVLPEFIMESVRDWIYGECSASGRSRASLVAVLEILMQHGGSPVGQAKLAREAGLANNTVAAGYVELLADLLCVGESMEWDISHHTRLRRKPAKFPFINLLVAVAWHKDHPRSIDDYEKLSEQSQAAFLEWAVAQEVWRRRAKAGEDMPELLDFWRSKEHEIDFKISATSFIEVKRGRVTPLEFAWFIKVFPKAKLTIINKERFKTQSIEGLTLEDFLLQEP